MQKLFENVGYLDKRVVEKFALSEDLMMEHAANSLNLWVGKHLKKGKKVQILCGPGNNGADGIACARMLFSDYKVSVLLPFGAKSNMAKIQLNRAKKLGIKIDEKIKKAHLYIDAIFGSGLSRELNEEIISIIKTVNFKKAIKLSCDIPTGILQNSNVPNVAFKADTTITMGALKSSLFGDKAKEYTGKIIVANLGVGRKLYEKEANDFLLEKKDLRLPLRECQNTNKGSFGHLVIISGKKDGASKLSAQAGFAFGAGLVSVFGKNLNLPHHIMACEKLPKNATALVCGMGLGELTKEVSNLLTDVNLPLVLDADILCQKEIKKFLHVNKNIILTPHPKEFSKMCKLLDLGEFSVGQIQANRFKYAREFSLKYPHILVLKGANTIIAKNGKCYVSPFGNSSLSKGGSGDVLGGLIGALLAQNYKPLKAAISGVLAHGLSVTKLTNNNYALEPKDIMKGVKCL